MGGKSTSHSAVLGSNTKGDISAFDLRSWQGLTEILRKGKESLKDQYAYAEFRNLVLEYAQKGGDEEVRKKIDALVQSFTSPVNNTEPQHIQKENVLPNISESFPEEATKTQHIPQTVSDNVTIKKENVTAKVVVPIRRSPPSFLPKSVVAHETEVPEILHGEETFLSPNNVQKPELELEEIQNTQIPENVEKSEPIVPPSYKSMEEYKTRITEIKRMVHDRIGNPATLIDTHNASGKKYMIALLTALKATNAGSPVSIETAMTALEEAYKNMLDETASVTTSKENFSVSEIPQTPFTPEVVTEPTSVIQTPQSYDKDEVDAVVNHEVSASSTFELPHEHESIPLKHDAENEFLSTVLPQRSPASIMTSFSANQRTVNTDQPLSHAIPTETLEMSLTPETNDDIHVPLNLVSTQIIDETEVEQKKEISNLIQPIKQYEQVNAPDVRTHQSELSSPEISASLNGLLHEWPLFSGSGFLGIGPGGTEHPLYQRLSKLSMGEVLAGRWEKADAKVIKTIKEYVDAWRHEQGIAYTINETFEHYLRRVVNRILKRQKD